MALFGRDDELGKIGSAWDRGRARIICIVGDSGSGKSAVARCALEGLTSGGKVGSHKLQTKPAKREHCYGWAIYGRLDAGIGKNFLDVEAAASADVFIQDALSYFGVEGHSTLSLENKGERLAQEILNIRGVLVLDGLELQQRGPRADGLDHDALKALLYTLADDKQVGRALCIITTTKPLKHLVREHEGKETVLEIPIGPLEPSKGADFLKALGIEEDSRGEREDAAAYFGGHAQTLRGVAGWLHVRAGRLEDRRVPTSKIRVQDAYEIPGRDTGSVLRAFEQQIGPRSGHPEHWGALCRVAPFEGPADRAQLGRLHTLLEDAQGLPAWFRLSDPHRFEDLVKGLSKSALLLMPYGPSDQGSDGKDRTPHSWDLIDLHQLSRRGLTAWMQFHEPDLWRAINRHLAQLLKDRARRRFDEKNFVSAIAHLYAAVAQYRAAGDFDESFGLYYDKINEGGVNRATNRYGIIVPEALEDFFVRTKHGIDWSRIDDRLRDKRARVLIGGCAAYELWHRGRLVESETASDAAASENYSYADAIASLIRDRDSASLRVVSWGDGPEAPTSANADLLIIGIDQQDLLRVHVFDRVGALIADVVEVELRDGQDPDLGALKREVQRLLPPHTPKGAEKARVLKKLAAVARATLHAARLRQAEALRKAAETASVRGDLRGGLGFARSAMLVAESAAKGDRGRQRQNIGNYAATLAWILHLRRDLDQARQLFPVEGDLRGIFPFWVADFLLDDADRSWLAHDHKKAALQYAKAYEIARGVDSKPGQSADESPHLLDEGYATLILARLCEREGRADLKQGLLRKDASRYFEKARALVMRSNQAPHIAAVRIAYADFWVGQHLDGMTDDRATGRSEGSTAHSLHELITAELQDALAIIRPPDEAGASGLDVMELWEVDHAIVSTRWALAQGRPGKARAHIERLFGNEHEEGLFARVDYGRRRPQAERLQAILEGLNPFLHAVSRIGQESPASEATVAQVCEQVYGHIVKHPQKASETTRTRKAAKQRGDHEAVAGLDTVEVPDRQGLRVEQIETLKGRLDALLREHLNPMLEEFGLGDINVESAVQRVWTLIETNIRTAHHHGSIMGRMKTMVDEIEGDNELRRERLQEISEELRKEDLNRLDRDERQGLIATWNKLSAVSGAAFLYIKENDGNETEHEVLGVYLKCNNRYPEGYFRVRGRGHTELHQSIKWPRLRVISVLEEGPERLDRPNDQRSPHTKLSDTA